MQTKLGVWLLVVAYLLFVQETTRAEKVVVKNVNLNGPGKKGGQGTSQKSSGSFPVILVLTTDDHISAWELKQQLEHLFVFNSTTNDDGSKAPPNRFYVDFQRPGHGRYLIRVHGSSLNYVLDVVCDYKEYIEQSNNAVPGSRDNPAEKIQIPSYQVFQRLSKRIQENEQGALQRGWPRAWRELWDSFQC
jgi:hypothetical protein